MSGAVLARAATLIVLPVLAAGRAFSDDPPSVTDLLTQLNATATAAAAEQAAHDTSELFLLQVIAIQTGFSLGFTIWACFMAGRKAKMP